MKAATASDDEAVLAVLEQLALSAGAAIMDLYRSGCSVEAKPDSSPVTEADRAGEAIILDGLRTSFPGIACVAEEEASAGMAPPDPGGDFFLIDPLDGTREFVARNGDFTVNIALVRNGEPQIGVVYAPASGRFFAGRPGRAESLQLSPAGEMAARHRVLAREGVRPLTVVASRSHRTAETDAFIKALGAAEIVSVGSSLKFCLLAAGEADVYPRFGPTMEWDTAAGDAVLRAAGGSTCTVDGSPLVYGNRTRFGGRDFANPFFIARGRTAASPGPA